MRAGQVVCIAAACCGEVELPPLHVYGTLTAVCRVVPLVAAADVPFWDEAEGADMGPAMFVPVVFVALIVLVLAAMVLGE